MKTLLLNWAKATWALVSTLARKVLAHFKRTE